MLTRPLRGVFTPSTFDRGHEASPIWPPDGRWAIGGLSGLIAQLIGQSATGFV
ncbi:MAG: hypothetical protein ABJA98_00250 [Acidobacteriota bacterium]